LANIPNDCTAPFNIELAFRDDILMILSYPMANRRFKKKAEEEKEKEDRNVIYFFDPYKKRP